MNRIRMVGVTALLLCFLCGSASAFTFTEDLFSLEIPENEHVYYYTHRGTNMTGTMLENAQKQDMLCLIGEYSGAGTLQYTFKAERRDGTCAEVAAALQSELAASYELGEPQAETVADRYGLTLSGRSLQSENYKVKIYVSGDAPSVVFTTTFTPEAEGAARALLTTVQWADAAGETPAVRDPDAVSLPEDSRVPEETVPSGPEALAPAGDVENDPPEVRDALADTARALAAWAGDHRLLLAGGGALLLLAFLLGRGPKYRPKHRKRGRN